MLLALPLFVFPAAMVYAAYTDFTSYEIPTWLSALLVVAFLAAAVGSGFETAAILWSLSTGVALFAVGAVLFYLGVFGGGDVKLLAASAVWVGWWGLPTYLVLVALFGGVLALLLLVLRRLNLPAAWRNRLWSARLLSPDEGMPYGVAIALAGLVVFRELRVVDVAAPQIFGAG